MCKTPQWTLMREWHDQQLASQHSFYIADESQGYNVAGHLDREEDLSLVALQDDTIASQDQYQHHGSTSNLEMSEAGINPVPPPQAPGSTVSLTETGQEVPTQDFHELETLVPDQVCTCAACLHGYRCPGHLYGLGGHPERISRTFACRVTGCQWTTKDLPQYKYWSNLERLHRHEHNCPHYGKSGNWRCPETGCKFVTKRWNDLKRHSSSKHCIKPKTFECPILSCKYHQIGFTRKDKLKSHCQNVHAGMLQPGKPNQAIKPKANGSA